MSLFSRSPYILLFVSGFLIATLSFNVLADATSYYLTYESEASAACEAERGTGWWAVDNGYPDRCQHSPAPFRYFQLQYEQHAGSGVWIAVSVYHYTTDGAVTYPSCSELICSDVDQICESGDGQTSTVKACVLNVETSPNNNCISSGSGKYADKELCITDTVQGSGTIDGIPFTANDETMSCIQYTDSSGVQRDICAGGEKNCGRVNGQFVCVESRPTDYNSDQSYGCITNASGNQLCIEGSDGVVTSEQSDVVNNPDNSTTVTTTTNSNVVGDTATTNVKVYNADGQQISSTTTGAQESEGQEPNKYSGSSCTQLPSCSGDPILCAIAINEHKQACLFEDKTAPTAQQVKDALGYVTDEGEGESVSIAELDNSGLGLSDACPAPRVYPVLSGINFTIDLSSFCAIAEIIGRIVLIASTFASIRIFTT